MSVWISAARSKRLLAGLGLVVVLALSWCLRTRYVWALPFDYDEGHWLMFGTLVNAGYPAYTVTFVGIPPLALLVIQGGLYWFKATLAARYPMMALSLLGIAGIFWLFQPAKNRAGLLAGLLAAIFLSFNPLYFHNSASIMAEVPAVSLSILALALAYQYYVKSRRFWLVLSGLTFALSLALKVFVVFTPVLVGIFILLPALNHSPKTITAVIRPTVLAGGLWLLGFLLPVALFALIYNPQAMYQQVFVFRMELRDVWAQRTPLTDNIAAVGQMWLGLSPFVAGALVGAVAGWRRDRLSVGLWLTWLVLATVLLFWHIPLRERYAVLLVPPLAALSSLGVTQVVIWLFSRSGDYRRWGRAVAVTGLAGVVGLILVTPLQSAALPPSPDTFPDLNLNAVQYVWQNTLPADCLITDDQRFVFAAGRLTPPALSETSWARIITGRLTADDIARQVILHDCPVVYANRRFEEQLPELEQRLSALYFVRIKFGKNMTIYTGNKRLTRLPSVPVPVRLGRAIALQGIDLAPASPWHSGQDVRLAAYWTALEPPSQSYKIFVHLRNGQGDTIAVADHFPFPVPPGDYPIIPNLDNLSIIAPAAIADYPHRGMLPTNTWPVGSTLREVTSLTLPVNLPSGQYHLYIGMYDPDTQVRLAINDQPGADDAIYLTSIEVLN